MDSEEEEISDTNVEEAVQPEKKRPGRPKKNVAQKNIPRLGIVHEPFNVKEHNPQLHNIFEIFYDNPMMFKKIFTLLKSMNAENVRIKLEQCFIKIYAMDHSEKNQIYIKIYGDKMNRYYLKRDLEIGLNTNNIQKILQTLNKSYNKIFFYTDEQNEKSKIKISIVNDELEEEAVYAIDTEIPETLDWNVIEKEIKAEDHYQLSFELPFRQFKKKVSDFKLLGEIMKIEKFPDDHLRLSYTFSDNKGTQNTFLRNPAKINLIALIDEDEIFSSSVYLEHIKSLANSLIADYIQVSASIGKKIIFTILLDNDINQNKDRVFNSEKCVIKILTEIVKAKKD